ncbi:alpha/beta-hydrolase family protein [Rhodococcus sp. IEGM 1409]|uniref:alpha/beta hydrolase n=1 Tax=Rhodococcus sp. IEGM 1409 TaxID=3047082 RepID=UPI0024B6A597|nr:alpha/beta-hydrolase family protein [Rhodococcus sp. IEGM 1409]MDI9901984.1 alpha/beta-hydrolase family protein [Rhodococcus sp. IEGM 1409]
MKRVWERLRLYCKTLHPVGLAFALVFFTWSMSPSLLPRAWYLQGVATGISLAMGYALGVTVAWMIRKCGVEPQWSDRTKKIGWRILLAAAVILVPTFLVLGSWWQQIVRDLVEVPRTNQANYLLVLMISLGIWFILLEAGRGLRFTTNKLTAVALRFVPLEAAKVGSLIVIFALGIFIVNGALYNGLIAFANWSFSGADHETPDGIEQPLIAERSGSPMSAEPWDSLGQEGRTFMGSGPTATEISALTGREAKQPIRVYAGRESSDSINGVAQRVVDELERTGGFDRGTLAVVTTTGRGWVNEDVASAFEYVEGGDTAIASMQYSFLPSPLAFIADRETPMIAGRALFNAVYAKWIDLPVETRPELVVFGESLGSYGGQAAFAGAQDMMTRVDGALWVGTPNFTAQWQEITNSRDSGSKEILPVIDGGRAIRFAGDPEDLELKADWDDDRIVYWQHASDPITWWSFDLLLNKPDWLKEPLGRDVDPGMKWVPLVTFWQVTLDMVFSADVPSGHGHNYGEDAADMWAEILHPGTWTSSDTDKLRSLLTSNLEPTK